MARGSAARRYAKALFQLAKEGDQVAPVRTELAQLADLLATNTGLADALLRPLYPASQRKAVLAGVAEQMQVSQLLKSFYSFLIDQRRLVDFNAVREEYERLADAESGVTRATVTSALPLTDEQQQRLRRALGQHAGRELELELAIDPALLGGVVAQIGDLVLDGSLKTQLQQLRANLTRG